MGFLLKEALKTLCSQNQWCYAVFWKIGCQNSKLLIWEECYYESLPCRFSPQIAGIVTSSFSFENEGPFRLGIQEGGRICSLINQMMGSNSVNIVGEGLIGRAAFTGSHQWILLNNSARDVYPSEVYNEVHHQFSAGMQTVAVIPVLPHGVVQLGSFITKLENMGFVNDVKSLILQLACIPGALFSEDYSARASTEKFGAPTNAGVPVSVNTLGANSNGFVQHNNSYDTSIPIVQPSPSARGVKNNHQSSVLTHPTHNPSQNTFKYHDNLCQPKAIPMIAPGSAGPQEIRVVGGEVMPSNFNLDMQQRGDFHNGRSIFNELTGFGQSGLSDCSSKFMEQQILSSIGSENHGNPGTNASSSLNKSQLKTNGGHILDHSQSSVSTSLFGAIPIHGGILRPNLIASSVSNPLKVATSRTQNAGIKLQNDNSTEVGDYSLPDLASQSGPNRMPLGGSDQENPPVDLKHASDDLAPTDQSLQRINDDLLQALKIPSFDPEVHVSTSSHIFSHDYLDTNAKEDKACAQPPCGDDLFDVLGVDFKNKLLNGNWTELLADELDANVENLDKKATCMSTHDIDPNCYSINETISESGIFSGNGADHLLDAVVSKAQSFVKQSSDDMSCKTTLTRISSASVPSPAHRQVKSDNVQEGGLFDLSKTEVKTGGAENSSLRPGWSNIDAGHCSQTTSIHGSQLGSWVENVSNVKLENTVSTGFSKRPDEVAKSSNRKRLKPGENPRPRPKDRQMIQDRVKELREIVPNGAKCSIDALLERTIKHMLFLQSVTKHADKLKQTGESKIISKESGLLLKDNFEGGATWAYEVGSQSMVCPIIVEDLNHPRQMLVEMLCEERGFFLEIADLIRGLGLTILKGVMEARNDKIWARFAVEANRDVTRMEIFMSLVRLLEQTVKLGTSSSNAVDNNMMGFHSFPQATQIPATGRPNGLQ